MKSTYVRNSSKVKASAENVHFWYKHKLADVFRPELFRWPDILQDEF